MYFAKNLVLKIGCSKDQAINCSFHSVPRKHLIFIQPGSQFSLKLLLTDDISLYYKLNEGAWKNSFNLNHFTKRKYEWKVNLIEFVSPFMITIDDSWRHLSLSSVSCSYSNHFVCFTAKLRAGSALQLLVYQHVVVLV